MSQEAPLFTGSLAHLMRPSRLALNASEAPPARPPLLLLLHGRGGTETDLFDLAGAFDPRLVVVSPRGPLPYGEGFAWFSVRYAEDGAHINTDELTAIRDRLLRFIAEASVAYSTDPARTYLLGFSQGAIVSLTLALTAPRRLAGVVACAGRIPPEVLPWIVSPDQTRGLPMQLLHGREDQTLPISWAHEACDRLNAQRVALDYHEYDTAHRVTPEMLTAAAAWLSARLDEPPPWQAATLAEGPSVRRAE